MGSGRGDPGCGHAVVQRRVDGRPMCWARSPADVRCHAVEHSEAAHVVATGWTQALCRATLPWEDLDLATLPSPPLCYRCVIGAAAEVSNSQSGIS